METRSTEQRGMLVLGALLLVVGVLALAGRGLGVDAFELGWPLFVIGPGLLLFALAVTAQRSSSPTSGAASSSSSIGRAPKRLMVRQGPSTANGGTTGAGSGGSASNSGVISSHDAVNKKWLAKRPAMHDIPCRDVVLSATFQLTKGDPARLHQILQDNLSWRGSRHPWLQVHPSAGSIFKKIEGVGAGRLIDQCGLKGFRVGDAQISHIHANILVNLGHATAADVRALVAHAQAAVKEQFGYELQPEVGFIGEF